MTPADAATPENPAWHSEVFKLLNAWRKMGATATRAHREHAAPNGPDTRGQGRAGLARVLGESARALWACRTEEALAQEVARLASHSLAECALVHVVELGQPRLAAAATATPALAKRLEDAGPAALVPAWSEELVTEVAHNGTRRVLTDEHDAPVGLVLPLSSGLQTLAVLSLGFAYADMEVVDAFVAQVEAGWEGVRAWQAREQDARRREEVLSTLSHDLRNAITTVLLRADMLQRRLLDRGDVTACKRAVSEIQWTGAWMEQLVGDILSARAIDGGRVTLKLARHSAGSLVQRAVEMLEPVAATRRIQLKAAVPADLTVTGDDVRLLQVLANLLGNALKFCPEGSVVEVWAEDRGTEVVFSVRDRGPGISAADLPHVFERWWRAPGVQATGSGLGLSIAKALVEKHGGRIWAESEPQAGATFSFSLPAA
ncbi:MAG: HAMP domain-containing sensor histidine kinase [Myxococcota bacterium]